LAYGGNRRGLNVVGGIFISYRREDNRHAAGRLYDSLQQQFSSDQIFFDIDNIEPGLSFVEVIEERVAASDVILVVIGPGWIGSRDADGRCRLDDPADLVRVEVETGLRRNIRVIPVLIDGATIPRMEELPDGLKLLPSKQAITLHHGSFQRDAEHLNIVLSKIVRSNKLALQKNDEIIERIRNMESNTGENVSREWRAELVERRWSFFAIQLCRLQECHRVECRAAWWRIVDYVEVDGVRVFGWAITGSKATDFKLGSHPAKFHLKFRSTSFYRLKQIELWIGDHRLLFRD
jgi:hypothetical protein